MTEQTNVISFDDFMKVDIRAGVVINAETVPKSDKLLKLEVNFGNEIGVRTIVSGIAKSYAPEELKDHRVLAVVNLAPRKMMGIESHGMLLAAESALGNIKLASCSFVKPGNRIG